MEVQALPFSCTEREQSAVNIHSCSAAGLKMQSRLSGDVVKGGSRLEREMLDLEL